MKEKYADIFFLVDSGVSQTEFQQIRTILVQLVNQLTIDVSKYRLGLAQYGQDVKVEFLLNAYQTKEEKQVNVKRFRQRRLQPNEQRNLGKALEYAISTFFTSASGSRVEQGVRQFLVVFSGKDSDDAIYKQSRQLKSEGVTVVGMSVGASIKEMRLLASPPHVYPSIANAVPLLKGVFETEDIQVNLTGGNVFDILLFNFIICVCFHPIFFVFGFPLVLLLCDQ